MYKVFQFDVKVRLSPDLIRALWELWQGSAGKITPKDIERWKALHHPIHFMFDKLNEAGMFAYENGDYFITPVGEQVLEQVNKDKDVYLSDPNEIVETS